MPLFSRAIDSNKGDHGALGIVGGSPGMVGAAFLAARSALFCGTGRVYVVRPSLQDHTVLDPIAPEVMVIDAAQSKQKPINAWVVGPGLGMSDAAHQLMVDMLNRDQPMVIDADALNLIAEDAALGRQCARRASATIITPHPGEAARLLGCSTADIQSDRQGFAQQLAQRYKAITVLKGHQTVIAIPDGVLTINKTGNAALATAGTGDVLAGLIGALMAQGLPPARAAIEGPRLHGLAAERLTEKLGGMIGMTANELIPEIRLLINRE
ncbi:MAG: NAD(P)H-hydrate dehydratase [Burkholderiaceae bacterium]|nr:NAD(P)H-hydrate dehydratase [Burkholderiaceae bacterium]